MTRHRFNRGIYCGFFNLALIAKLIGSTEPNTKRYWHRFLKSRQVDVENKQQLVNLNPRVVGEFVEYIDSLRRDAATR